MQIPDLDLLNDCTVERCNKTPNAANSGAIINGTLIPHICLK